MGLTFEVDQVDKTPLKRQVNTWLGPLPRVPQRSPLHASLRQAFFCNNPHQPVGGDWTRHMAVVDPMSLVGFGGATCRRGPIGGPWTPSEGSRPHLGRTLSILLLR